MNMIVSMPFEKFLLKFRPSNQSQFVIPFESGITTIVKIVERKSDGAVVEVVDELTPLFKKGFRFDIYMDQQILPVCNGTFSEEVLEQWSAPLTADARSLLLAKGIKVPTKVYALIENK